MTSFPITNRWGKADTVKVKTEHFTIYRGEEGAAYNHHPQITSLDGRLYATWSSGVQHEDDVGQLMVMSTSDDNGETWSHKKPVVDRQSGEFADAVITSMGIRIYEKSLIAYYGEYEYTAAGLVNGHRHPEGKIAAPADIPWHQGTRTEAVISEDGGETWSESRHILDRFVPNLSPSPVKGGRLIMPGNISYPYTDIPCGLTGWKMTGLPRLPENHVDDSEGFHKACDYRGDDLHYCEGSFFQTAPGLTGGWVIHMMLRTSIDRLAVTESHDNGKTWSEPVMTDYTDCRCRFHFGRLPDGRYFGLSCPRPSSGRTPLVLATSDDGVVFDQHYILGDEPAGTPRIRGQHKGGRYGYPYSHIMDDCMFVIYSIAKEDIAVCRLNLRDLI